MNLQRIKAFIIKNSTLTFRGLDPIVDFFYWPVYDIMIWGFASKAAAMYGAPEPVTVVLECSLVAWQAVYRGNLDVSYNLLQEIASRNMVNIFSSPSSLYEWSTAVIIVSLLNSTIAIIFGSIAVWLLYKISIFSVGLMYIPLLLLLLLCGVTIGFFTASALILYGQKAHKLVWVMGWFFAPFSGVFYPIEVLPSWASVIAQSIPMSYFFSTLRIVVIDGFIPTRILITGIILAIVYFVFSLALFKYSFQKSKEFGLARLQS